MSDHDAEACAEVLREAASRLSAEMDVYAECPVTTDVYRPTSFSCPHGFTYWIRPSARQISAWERTS